MSRRARRRGYTSRRPRRLSQSIRANRSFARVASNRLPERRTQGEVRGLVYRSPRRGDLVVFRYPPEPARAFIKRCIGLPGETVEVRGRAVLIGGAALEEP